MDAVGPGAKGHIVIDAHWEGIGFLKNHAHFFAEQVDIHIPINILLVQLYLTRNLAVSHQVIHAVQALQESGLATARRADEGRDFIGRDIQIDIFQGMKITIIEV